VLGMLPALLAAGEPLRCSNEYAAVCRAVMFRRRSVLGMLPALLQAKNR
jgi:hypothetical protein